MLLLTSTSDKIQVITSAAGQVDVHASYIDLASGVVSAGRLNTRISTATTTDVVAAPGASTTRNVKQLKVGNNSGSATNTVTIQHTDGTNVIVIEQVTLAPLERMGYEEGTGIRVFDSAGREKVTNGGLPAGSSNTADVVANAAATYLTGGSLQIGSRVQAGSFFKWRLRVTKTAAGVATATVAVVVGPNATTGDTARVTHSSTAIQTGAIDTGMFEVDANFRQVGATAIIQSSIRLDHTLADAAGFGTFRYLSALSCLAQPRPYRQASTRDALSGRRGFRAGSQAACDRQVRRWGKRSVRLARGQRESQRSVARCRPADSSDERAALGGVGCGRRPRQGGA
jgi:hypothetical protein